MNRNTVTTMEQLKIGDRFYKAGDKEKKVYEKYDHEPKQTNYQTYKHFAVEAAVIDKARARTCIEQIVSVDEKGIFLASAVAFKKETSVVFLRHQFLETSKL